MAYAVVRSLRKTIVGLVYDASHICIVGNSSTDMLKSVNKELYSLEKLLEELNKSSSLSRSSSRSRNINREKVNALDQQMREALCDLEDIIDFHVSHQCHSQIPPAGDEMIHPPLSFTLDFEQLTQQFYSFKQKLKLMIEEYALELCLEEDDDDDFQEVDPEEDDDDDDEEESDLVGLSGTFAKVKDGITEDDERSPSGWEITSFCGMAGIGKTALAKKLFRDPQITRLFQRRAFVTIGPKYRLEAVLLDILTQVNPGQVSQKSSSPALLKLLVYQSLKNRSCFIVLDDVWHKTIWNELKSTFPENLNNHCQVLLTSRLRKVAYYPASRSRFFLMPFLNKKESWHLLRNKVFGNEEEASCPRELVKAGEKIAENCDGLPLTILKVANILLSRWDTTPEFWNEVAAQKQHPVFIDAYEQMYEVLYRSYDYLPQYLKPVFLYLGVFPQGYKIPSSEIINLLYVEGLYREEPSNLMECLDKLDTRSLVIVLVCSIFAAKLIRLHSAFWYMCNKEARRNKFFYSLNIGADSLAEDMKSQRRLCIQNNVLFGIKDVHDAISSISTVRSLLCTGSYHQYPVPICLDLRLLKVLHALSIRFYEFPMEALNRVNMTYLALTLDAELPSSISKLWNLRYLIACQHVRIIKSRGSSSYLPMEIWNMKELQHLQVVGSDLPNPNCEDDDDHILPKLIILSDVSAQSCTKHIFKRIPHLYKLGVRIELGPDDDQVPLRFFDDITYLPGLHTLKCIMTTPKIMSGVVAPPAPLSIFSHSLSKLTLSGMGYPWEEMTKISSLPNLVILKLRCYAFRGPEWVIADHEFPKLLSLLIEDTDLVKWTCLQDRYSLNNFTELTIKHCYKLQDIPITLFGESLMMIVLVDCNPLAQHCAKQLKEDLDKYYPMKLPVRLNITSSWGDEK